MTNIYYVSRQSDSNRRPADYISAALPTELCRRLRGKTFHSHSLFRPLYPPFVSLRQKRAQRADPVPLPLRTVRIPSEEASPFITLTRLHTLIDAGRGGGLIRFESLLRPRSNAAPRILRACPELRHADHRRTTLGEHARSESHPLSAVRHVLCTIQGRRKVGASEP